MPSPRWRIPLFLIPLCLCALPPGPARGQPAEGGARAAALGGAATALDGDLWGFSNPAAWSTLRGGGISFFASEGFGMDELRVGAFTVAQPTPLGTFSGGARTFGFEAYRETHFNVGFARGFTPGTTRRLHAGLNLRYHRVDIDGYGAAGALGLSAGLLATVVAPLQVGFHATNLNVPRLAAGEELARTFALGLGYRPAAAVRVLADVVKDVRHPAAVRAGLEVQPVPVLALRVGVATAPTRFSAGAGIRLGPLAADVAAARHEVLGWTPAASLNAYW